MSERTDHVTDDAIAQFLRTRTADADLGLLDDIVRAVAATPQDRPWLRLRPIRLTGRTLLIAAALLATIGAIAVGSGLLLPKPNLGIFERVAGRIVYGFESSGGDTTGVYGIDDGIWGLDPASSDPATTVRLTSEAGTPLGWSSDGTRLLLQKGRENLFILHADGSETLVTEQPWGLKGATISPDGSRVAFGGLTQSESEYGGLFAVDADGGPAELLWEWPEPTSSLIVRYPTFSPDGMQIGFVLDNIDSNHSVWVINADGTDAHQILTSDEMPIGAGWVRGLAWSPAGDRIALMIEGVEDPDPTFSAGLYTFAPDGSDFTQLGDTAPAMTIGGNAVFWSPDGSQLAYMTGCNGWNAEGQITGCMLVIVDTDGSVVRTFLHGMAGPWHPGTPNPTMESSPSIEQSSSPDYMWPQSTLDEVRAAQELADAGDRRYTWQVDPDLADYQLAQHHPVGAEIFARFLEEELGWEEFLWDEAFAHPDGLADGEVVYIRCAPGRTNPLYAADPEGPGCAPTIDELRYETVHVKVAQLDRQGPSGVWVVTGWEMGEPVAQTDPRVVAAEATKLLEDFLQARIDGAGAEEFVQFHADDGVDEELVGVDIPLLYATSAGARYERSEFEVVEGPVWPDGWMRYVVRLFAENNETVVEQHFSLAWDDSDRVRLVFDIGGGYGVDGPGTTENGKSVTVEYGLLDGEVTYGAAYPLEPSRDGFTDRDRVAIVGLLPDDDSPRRVLLMLADPRPIGPDCVEGPAAADAEALARSIRSDPDFEATAPEAVTIGGASALQMDVLLAPGASSCPWSEHGTSGEGPLLLKHAPFAALPFFGDRARLYLLDLPGASARVLAIATIADEDSLETVLEFATPIVESIEFNTR